MIAERQPVKVVLDVIAGAKQGRKA